MEEPLILWALLDDCQLAGGESSAPNSEDPMDVSDMMMSHKNDVIALTMSRRDALV